MADRRTIPTIPVPVSDKNVQDLINSIESLTELKLVDISSKKRGNLSFKELREANKKRLPQFTNKFGNRVHSNNNWTPAQWLQAIVGEIGEYANFRKKFERGDIGYTEFMKEAKKELADVIVYIDLLALELGIDLDHAVVEKFNKVSDRINCNVKL